MRVFLLILLVSISGLAVAPSTSITEIIDQELVGYGEGTTGGKNGDVYTVNTLEDNAAEICELGVDSGSLRCALESEDALWIIFSVSGTINLDDNIYVKSNKTIDGRGKNVRISEYTLRLWSTNSLDDMNTGNRSYKNLYNVENIIILNVSFDNNLIDPEVTARDCIQMAGIRKVWVHKSSFFDCEDGQIDVSRKSTDITVSYCEFTTNSNFRDQRLMQFGKNGWYQFEDSSVTMTFHHNKVSRIRRRSVRLAGGKVHMYNNFIQSTYSEASISVGMIYHEWQGTKKDTVYPQLFIENNIYQYNDIYYSGQRTIRCDLNLGDTLNPEDSSPEWFFHNGAIKISDNWINPESNYWLFPNFPKAEKSRCPIL